jgi:hypothetical protein
MEINHIICAIESENLKAIEGLLSGITLHFQEISIYLIFPATLGPGLHSSSNRNEYQKQKNNVAGE